jgi:hypothetical protein
LQILFKSESGWTRNDTTWIRHAARHTDISNNFLQTARLVETEASGSEEMRISRPRSYARTEVKQGVSRLLRRVSA